MIGEFLEAKFPFLRDDVLLVAQVHAKTGVQRLLMQKIEPATGRITLEDALDCIHTVVGTIPQEEFEETTNAKDFPEQVLHIRSSEQLKEIHLAPEEKFVAFRSWVAGIAEAGLGAFQLQTDIEAEGKLAYFIVGRLMAFAAKVDPKILLAYLDRVMQACQDAGKTHEPSLVANLIQLLQYALDYRDTLVLDAIFQLDLPFETYLNIIAGLMDQPYRFLRESWESPRLIDAFREYATSHYGAPTFVDTLCTVRRVIADDRVADVLLDIGMPVPTLLDIVARLVDKESSFRRATSDNDRLVAALRAYGSTHFDAPTFLGTLQLAMKVIANDQFVDLLASLGMPVPTLLTLSSQLAEENSGRLYGAEKNARFLDTLRTYGTTHFDTPAFIDIARRIRRVMGDAGAIDLLASIGTPIPVFLHLLTQLAGEEIGIVKHAGANARFVAIVRDYGATCKGDPTLSANFLQFWRCCNDESLWQIIIDEGFDVPLILQVVQGATEEAINSFASAVEKNAPFLKSLRDYGALHRENPAFIEQARVIGGGTQCTWISELVKNLRLPLYHGIRLDPLEATALWELEAILGDPLPNPHTIPYYESDAGYVAEDGHVITLRLSKKKLNKLPAAVQQFSKMKKLYLDSCGLESIEGIGKIVTLEVLSLFNNHLPALPEEIRHLQNLRQLSLSLNPPTIISEVISSLPRLQELRLDRMKLATVPAVVWALKSLTLLGLQENQLVAIPEELGNLSSLRELNLEKNRLASLPACVTQLHSLEKLILKENRLASLPDAIGDLQALHTLDASNNLLVNLPESLTSLLSLQLLDLSNNRLRSLPESIGNLAALHRLCINDNHLKTLPDSIVKLASLKLCWLNSNFSLTVSGPIKRWIEELQEHKCHVTVDWPHEHNAEDIFEWDQTGLERESAGDLAGAIEVYEKVVALDPGFIAAWIHLGKARQQKDNGTAIAATFKLMTEKIPRNPIAWAALGKYCSAHKEWSEAAQAWEHVIALTGNIAAPEKTVGLNPQKPIKGVNLKTARQPRIEPTLAWSSLGTARFNLKDFTGAIEAYEKAIALDPKDIGAWFNLGTARFNLKDFKGAAEAYEKVNALDPNDSMAWTNLGAVRVNLADVTGAVAAFEKAIAIDLKNSLAWANLGVARGNLKDFKGAAEAFEHALQIDPKNEGAWVNLGYTRAKLQNYSGAVEAAKHVLELNPANFSAWINLGVSLSSLGDFPGALQAAMHAAELDPKNPLPWINIGHARGKTNDLSGAVEASERAVQLDPKHPMAWSNLGYFQAKSGNLAKAAEAASQALKIDPTSAPAWDCSGYVHFKQGDLGAATAACLKSIKLDPHQTNAWVTLGQIRHAEGNFRAEIRAFERAVQLNPQEGEVWDHLGTAYDAAGRAGEALYCWELAARLSVPGSETRATEKRATGVHPLPVVFPPKH